MNPQPQPIADVLDALVRWARIGLALAAVLALLTAAAGGWCLWRLFA